MVLAAQRTPPSREPRSRSHLLVMGAEQRVEPLVDEAVVVEP